MNHFYLFNYWCWQCGPRQHAPPDLYKKMPPIQFYDMQRSRTRFATSRQPFDRISGHDCDGIVWRARIRIYRFTGHNVGAEFHKSSHKGNVQEFSRLICMRCFLSGVSQNSSGLFGMFIRNQPLRIPSCFLCFSLVIAICYIIKVTAARIILECKV